MTPLFKDRDDKPHRHPDPDAAIAEYLEQLRRADVAGSSPPPAVLNGLGDAYVDKGDPRSAVDYYRQAAEIYAAEGMLGNAIALARKIRRYAPEDPRVGLLLGRLYGAKGMTADARSELEAYVERQRQAGRRREAIEGLREIVQLDPEASERQEELARLYLEEGQREEAVAAYRAALRACLSAGDPGGAVRVREALAAIEPAPPAAPPSAPVPEGSAPPPFEPRRPSAVPPAAAAPPLAPPAALEMEPTSYADTGDELARTAREAREAHRWDDAIGAYRQLADLGLATAEEFGEWTESARQKGEASKVLEALTAASRWHLERGDREAARRAAEEMLLVDPRNAQAVEILQEAGGPRLPQA